MKKLAMLVCALCAMTVANANAAATALTVNATENTTTTVSAQKHTECFRVADGQELRLDHYVAQGVTGLRPCVVFVFGGGFATGVRDAQKYLSYFEMLTASGYDVVSIDYRLGLSATQSPDYDSKAVGLRETIATMKRSVDYAVEDLLCATRYILDHAGQWQIDTSKIVASGSSAGAITALQAENNICNRTAMAQVLPEGFNYAGVIAFAGAVFSIKGEPKWATAPCPTMLFHGTSDSNVPYRKAAVFGIGFYGSELLVEQFRKMGAPYWFYSAEYRSHSMAEEPMVRNHAEILRFLEQYVVGGLRLQKEERVVDLQHGKRPTKFSIKQYLSSNYGN